MTMLVQNNLELNRNLAKAGAIAQLQKELNVYAKTSDDLDSSEIYGKFHSVERATATINENTNTTKVTKQLTSSQGGPYGMKITYNYNEDGLLQYAVYISPEKQFLDGTQPAYVTKYVYDNTNRLSSLLSQYIENFISLENIDFSNTTPAATFTYTADGKIKTQTLGIERFGEHSVNIMTKQKAYTPEELTLLYASRSLTTNAMPTMSVEYDSDEHIVTLTMNDGNFIIFHNPIYSDGKLQQLVSDDKKYVIDYTYKNGLLDFYTVYRNYSDGSRSAVGTYFFTYVKKSGENSLSKVTFFDSGFQDGHIAISEYRYMLDDAGYITKFTYAWDVTAKDKEDGSYVTTYQWNSN
jgi:hypothetical protein